MLNFSLSINSFPISVSEKTGNFTLVKTLTDLLVYQKLNQSHSFQ